ncbi:hypothetical protein BOO71_0006532 [Deinococcus marmoris]|uniref:Uncharacterized protein n=1 Tax=Deinococcus marmoris TaxID=249408 RepID=A0A1U7NZ65_9DEIO|nr:hypothetical protein BOO71_0006532 [Deinococcus marmoris]
MKIGGGEGHPAFGLLEAGKLPHLNAPESEMVWRFCRIAVAS